MDRRYFIKQGGKFGLAASLSSLPARQFLESLAAIPARENLPFFKLSLAQWSLHQALQSKVLPALEFPRIGKELGFQGLEYVSSFYLPEKGNEAQLPKTIKELKMRSDDFGLQNVLIMVDEGELSTSDASVRQSVVAAHHKWIDAAAELGCHSVRVNLFGGDTEKTPALWKEHSVESLLQLCATAKKSGVNIIVENHHMLSSNAALVAEVIKAVNLPNCGTLPDFGNFCLRRESGQRFDGRCVEEYDRYKGISELLPFAKGVSAKSYDFDAAGEETTIDYKRMLRMVKASGYKGFIGVEYEGTRLSEIDGILKTKELLLHYGS